MLQQSQQMAEQIGTATAAAAEQPASPQKALAQQVLGGMQGALQGEVQRELQALQLADSWVAGVAAQLSPRAAAEQQQQAAVHQHAVLLHQQAPPPCTAAAPGLPTCTGAPACTVSASEAAQQQQQQNGWTIAAAPSATQLAGCQGPAATTSGSPGGHTVLQITVPFAAASSQQPGPAHSPATSPSWVPTAPANVPQWPVAGPSPAPAGCCAVPAGAAGGGSPRAGGLRSSLAQMQGTLQSVCAVLQDSPGGSRCPVRGFLERTYFPVLHAGMFQTLKPACAPNRRQ